MSASLIGREREVERRSRAGRGPDPNPPPVALDDLARKRQADPRPSPIVLAFMQATENLKNHVLVVFRDAYAIVPNVIARGVARFGADLDPARGLVVVLDGIADEIDEDIADPLTIA